MPNQVHNPLTMPILKDAPTSPALPGLASTLPSVVTKTGVRENNIRSPSTF